MRRRGKPLQRPNLEPESNVVELQRPRFVIASIHVLQSEIPWQVGEDQVPAGMKIDLTTEFANPATGSLMTLAGGTKGRQFKLLATSKHPLLLTTPGACFAIEPGHALNVVLLPGTPAKLYAQEPQEAVN